jgi:protoporphyrinogen oxidase
MPHPLKKNILIVGAGFAGLTLAALLQKKNIFNIVVYEKAEAGGLIQSEKFEETLLETAAPSLLNHSRFEEFVASYGLTLQKPLKASRRRFIYFDRLTRWPLSVGETLGFVFRALKFMFVREKLQTLSGLTVEEWSLRFFGPAFTDKLLRPGLFGIYASDPCELSAELVLSRFFSGQKKDRPSFRGSTIPKGGLSSFLKFLKGELVKNEVQFIKKNLTQEELLRLKEDYIVVFATGFSDFIQLVKKSPSVFLQLSDENLWRSLSEKVQLISLVKMHLFIPGRLRGFGALFHPKNGFNSLGVIANNCVFPEYGPLENEAWILKRGGLQEVLADRQRLFGVTDTPSRFYIREHPNVYPVYNENLRHWLEHTHLQKGFYGTGNYWGHLGLTQIFLHNLRLTEQITSDTQQ